jgi:hypothetical protein
MLNIQGKVQYKTIFCLEFLSGIFGLYLWVNSNFWSHISLEAVSAKLTFTLSSQRKVYTVVWKVRHIWLGCNQRIPFCVIWVHNWLYL